MIPPRQRGALAGRNMNATVGGGNLRIDATVNNDVCDRQASSEYMGRRTDARPRLLVLISQYVFIARNWSWSETGVSNALDLSTSDRNCPEQTCFEQCIL
ncbi:hypothetical protein GCM10029964_089470 [Kibdelosporangium lantanae]